MVVGGGIAGIQATLDIADAGFKVYIVEREPSLGGHAAQLYKTYPSLDDAAQLVQSKIEALEKHPNIEVLTDSEVAGMEGYIGNFKVRVREKARGEDLELEVGTIVVATGYDVFDARLKPEYGYGRYPNVITSIEYERILSAGGPRRRSCRSRSAGSGPATSVCSDR